MEEYSQQNDDDKIKKISFSNSVQSAINQVLKSSDPLDLPNFNPVEYINRLFPNEQSISNIDDITSKMECEVSLIDDNIRSVVRGQTNTGQDGRTALDVAHKIIYQLLTQVSDIKARAKRTEEMVREITCDIKQLDCAKKNLTLAITTLNHLHMLVDGVDNLTKLIEKHSYGEILNPLQAITEVDQHFQQFNHIPQIKDLSNKVQQIQSQLAAQITEDFHNAFSTSSSSSSKSEQPIKMSLNQLADACKVLSVLDPKVKRDLFKWFLNLQLEEYVQLFHENQDIAWLDKIDKRYAWLKRHLLDFEDKFGHIFPNDWELSERIAVQFCYITRDELTKIMKKRKSEIDVKLLLFAITKTQGFEQLLAKRFSGATLNENNGEVTTVSVSTFGTNAKSISNNDKNIDQTVKTDTKDDAVKDDDNNSSFINIIGICFKPFLNIYTDSIDRNLSEIIERFIQSVKQPFNPDEVRSTVFPSCADLFVFYKKCMVQCTQLSNGKPMYDLAMIFKKYLREYAVKVLEASIPKLSTTIQTNIGSGMSLLTRDLQNLSTAAGQVIHNFLKEGEAIRFTSDEIIRICCVLTTADYCLETVQQLEQKLKEKVHSSYVNKIDLYEEKDVFHRIISNCIQLLVQDLENGCEPALSVMNKIQWQNISNVGDQSVFVNSITTQLKTTVPIIRDYLGTSRKYFTQFCHKFVNAFIPKYINTLYKCRPTSSSSSSTATTSTSITSMAHNNSSNIDGNSMICNSNNNILGCEQLLLDTHSLKTVLLDLPSIASNVNRKAPSSYTKVVVKGMTRAEMIIKIVMTPFIPLNVFNMQVFKLLPDITLSEYQKILDMKGIKRLEQIQLIENFKKTIQNDENRLQITLSNSTDASNNNSNANDSNVTSNTSNIDNNIKSSLNKNITTATAPSSSSSPQVSDTITPGRGRIRRLENLIKKRLPN